MGQLRRHHQRVLVTTTVTQAHGALGSTSRSTATQVPGRSPSSPLLRQRPMAKWSRSTLCSRETLASALTSARSRMRTDHRMASGRNGRTAVRIQSSSFQRLAAFLSLLVALSLVATPTVAGASSSTPPSAPRSVVAQASNQAASVSWRAPASNGGSVITQYRVWSLDGRHECVAPTTSCTVKGLRWSDVQIRRLCVQQDWA